MGIVNHHRGNQASTIDFYTRALTIYEAALPADHDIISKTRNNLQLAQGLALLMESDYKVMVKTRCLEGERYFPCEILLKYFEHFNALGILHLFNQLNDRLNKLIRTVPLSLDFGNVKQSIFNNQLCMKTDE
ncbi:unnamed protein product [Rotaria sp. Silwood2]|nr:unnamed protein product [Rotaria sp. Silwood2]CAF4561580.1 unnamed protein product [Rotaria sp. Silwood2]